MPRIEYVRYYMLVAMRSSQTSSWSNRGNASRRSCSKFCSGCSCFTTNSRFSFIDNDDCSNAAAIHSLSLLSMSLKRDFNPAVVVVVVATPLVQLHRANPDIGACASTGGCRTAIRVPLPAPAAAASCRCCFQQHDCCCRCAALSTVIYISTS